LTAVGLDTSVAIPLLVQTHAAHAEVVDWWNGREVAMCGHALVETYSVLTRLPGDIRLGLEDAARLLTERFSTPLTLSAEATGSTPKTFARLGIAGGAVYDALIGLAAAEFGAILATRDKRARATYEAVGAEVVMVGGGRANS
jgi:predicted nucleic acid-binding protein